MTDDQNEKLIGCLEGTIEKAFITIVDIPKKEVPNETGIGLYIGGSDNNVQ